jgi:nucleotide-binding universal stress UspA family protein
MIKIRSILVPVDLSPGALAAVRYAFALRRGERGLAGGARIVLARAVEQPGTPDAERERLRAFAEEAGGADEPELAFEVLAGEPRAVIAERAGHFDLVVIGARSVARPPDLVPGGVAEATIRRSKTPVLTVKWLTALDALGPGRALEPREIVFATDFTPFSCQALRWAMAFAFAYDARLTAVHVVPGARSLRECERLPFPLAEEIDRFYEKELAWCRDELGRFLRDRAGAPRPVEVREVVRAGDPAAEIAAECHDLGADLLVLATHGAGGLKRWLLGSVAEAAVRRAPCPVLTVRPEEP